MAKAQKPKPESPPARKKSRKGEALNVWIRAELMAAMQKLLASTKPRTSKTAVVEMALEKFFEERGLWPPPADSSA